jgi:hypothetical protein
VAQLTGVPVRTLRSFVERQLIAQPAFYGTKTRYGRDFVVRVLAIQSLRAERLRGEAFDRVYRGLSAAELEARAGRVGSEAARRALGLAGASGAAGGAATSGAAASAVDEGGMGAPWQVARPEGRWWFRVPVLPGLELLLNEQSSPLVRRLAKQFISDCLGAEHPTSAAPVGPPAPTPAPTPQAPDVAGQPSAKERPVRA